MTTTDANQSDDADADAGGARQEVFLLIGRGGAILWSDASSSPVWLPDSRARWEAIWQHRDELEEIVHSHPVGPLGFSSEDETTMAALCAALGRRPRFAVVAPWGVIRRDYPSQDADGSWPPPKDTLVPPQGEPFWVGLLRLASGMTAAAPAPGPAADSATDSATDSAADSPGDLQEE